MKIQILGTGCPKCSQMSKNVQAALDELDLEAEIQKVTDIQEIIAYGVLMTPGLAIDGQVKSSGKLLTIEEIKALLKN